MTTDLNSSGKRTRVSGSAGPATAERVSELVNAVADEAPDPTAFRKVIEAVGSLSELPIYADSRAELLIDGPATYAAMLEAIGSAKKFIHLETYILADDKIGRKFADALIRKSAQGVAVRIIFDSLGSWGSSDGFFDRLSDARIEILEYHDINPLDGGNPLNMNVRDHRKILVVDGRVAFTGGVNFSKTYSSRPRRHRRFRKSADGWRDTHVALYGPVVAGIEAVFQKTWRQGRDDSQEPPDVRFPSPAPAGDALVAVLASEGGDDIESEIYRFYLEAMQHARDRIWITQAYFGPDESFLQALTSAASRGVDVQIVLPGVSDSLLLKHLSRTYYGELLSRGVKLYETTSSVLHAKTAVIDGVWSTVGSSNLDRRSVWHNHEINAIIFGREFGQQMETQFRIDIESCNAVDRDAWESRPLIGRLIGSIARLFAHWL